MALASYSDLTASISNWLNRQDLTGAVPDFIALAEAEFNRKIRVRDNTARVMTNVTTQYSELPSDFREAKFIKLIVAGVDAELGFLDQRSIVTKRADYAGVAQQPKYYSLVGNSLEMCPTPDTAYLTEIGYYGSIPALSGTNTTNWLLTKHPDLYLYGSLLQSAPYLKEDERLPVWRDLYSGILESIRIEDLGATYSGGTLRVNARRIG